MREVYKTVLLALTLSISSACESGSGKIQDPSARQIALVSSPLFYEGPWGGGDDIYAVMPGDSSAALLTIQPNALILGETIWGLAPSPDGKRLAVCRYNYGIYVFTLDDGKLQQVIRHEFDPEIRPHWSKNGKYLLYASTYVKTGKARYGEGTTSHIFVANTSTGEFSQLTKGKYFNTYPCWSPDDTRIAFAATPPDSRESDIYVMDFPGGRKERLTHDGFEKRYIAWSPLENDLTYIAWEDNGPVLNLLDISTKTVTVLTKEAHSETIPAWSPDGQKIAFSGWPGGRVGHQIMIINRDGSNERRLTPGIRAKWHPRWSPDGSQIAFKGDIEERFDVYVIDIDGTNLKRVSKGDEGGEGHVWGYLK